MMMLFSGGASRLRANLCSLFHKFASFLFHPGFQCPFLSYALFLLWRHRANFAGLLKP
jgi:hypothetical protein